VTPDRDKAQRFFTNALPNIQSIEINNTGEILKETVADGV
jgi:hypothetical protein